jgi:TonB-dependent receptor
MDNKFIVKALTGAFTLLLWLCWANLYASSTSFPVTTEGNGVVSGLIIDVNTGEPMQGATILLEGTTIGTSSDANGRFILRRVPSGSHTLLVTFLGYTTYEEQIDVSDGERLLLEVSLEEDFIIGDDIVVTAVQRGQSRAFTQMRNASNVRNVVSSEQMERFPDPTIAGALQRLPGISTVHDRGEAGEVMIRGLGAGFGTVTVDGQRMPSTSRTGRDTDVRGVSIDMISSVEVNKTFTPEMQADAVSGSINLITKRPIGSERIFNATVSSGYNHSVNSFNPNDLNYHAGITYGQRTDRLSYVVNASFRRDNRLQQDLRHRWESVDFNGDGVPQDVLARLEPSLYPIDRKRYNFSANLDYYPSDNSSYSVRATYSRRNNENTRLRVTNRLDRGNYVLNDNDSGYTTGDRGRFDYSARWDPRITEMYTINAGGNHTLPGINLDYRVAYSYGFDGARGDNYRYGFRKDGGFNYSYDISNRQAGAVDMVGGSLDPSEIVMNSFYESPNYGTNHEASANINLEVPYRLGNQEGAFKTGLDLRYSFKDRIRNRERYSFAETITLADFQLDPQYDLRGNPGWRIPYYFDFQWAQSNFLDQYGDRLVADEAYNSVYGQDQIFNNTEIIPAGYVMLTQHVGNWMFLAGLRAEYTAIHNEANEVLFDEDGNAESIRPLTVNEGFLDIFPAIHTRYAFTPRTNLRASFTQTINRPNYRDLSPYRVVDFDDQQLSIGNPNLVSLRSTNLDLLFEHYFMNVGLISAGVFYKSISDFTFTESTSITGGEFDGWIQEQPINGDEASVYGVELGWQQRLSFLPGVLSGLGLYANYAYTYSAADYGRDEKYPLPYQVPHVVNTSLSFDRGGFSGMLSYNFQSSSFLSTSTRLPDEIAEREGAFPDRYRTSFGSLDFSANQRVAGGTYVFLELKNLLDDSNMDYYLDERFPYRENWNSWWGQLGIRYRM